MGTVDILLYCLEQLITDEFKKFTLYLANGLPERRHRLPRAKLDGKSRSEVIQEMIDFYGEKRALVIAQFVLKKIDQNELVNYIKRIRGKRTNLDLNDQPSKKQRLHESHQVNDLQSVVSSHKLWLTHANKFIIEEIGRKRKKMLNEVYTDLTVTEGEGGGLNNEHEVVNIESSHCSDEKRISCSDIFEEDNEEIRTVLTKGVAGIGKTISVQKFILDWAENKANQDFIFLFVLPFRRLNLCTDRHQSLHELLVHLHPKLDGCNSNLYADRKILFIFDGLEESRIPLNFRQTTSVSDVDVKSTVDTLIVNLINKSLLPSAHIWITSRPAAVSMIPIRYIDLVTEIQGFTDRQKVEYFKKTLQNEAQVNRIVSHISTTKSFHIMCHIPLFCWIAVTALQPWLTHKCKEEIPTTLTEIYSHFLLVLTNMKNQKFAEEHEDDAMDLLENNREMFLKLAELAFKQLLKSNFMFYGKDLKECGIDVKEAALYSGLCTEIFRMESEFRRTKFYCFVHPTFQEFFAALYVFHCYLCSNYEELEMFLPKNMTKMANYLEVFMKHVVDEALKSKNGHLDVFLSFLHGLTLESSQRLLKGLLLRTIDTSESINKIKQNLRRGQKRNINPERLLNLSHCLIEMKDNTLQQEIQTFLKSTRKSKKLSLAHYSAMANMFQASEVMEELDLRQYNTSEEGRRRLIPAVRNCKKAILSDCNLTQQSFENLGSALQSENLPLKELDLSRNDMQDSGLKLLLKGLKLSNGGLEILSLSSCKLTRLSCEDIASKLLSRNSSLRKLDLSYNNLQDEGVKFLTAGLKSCELEILRVADCKLTGESCKYIARALQATKSPLKELDLSCNDLQNSGIKHISGGLRSSHCNLKVLRLFDCKLTAQSCTFIASVLQKASLSLIELDLSTNDLHDSGVKLLCDGLKSSDCSLQILRLSGCCITELGCSSLASALHLNPSHLKELDLSYNHPGDLGRTRPFSKNNNPACRYNVTINHAGELRVAPGLKKYACKLTVDRKTANMHLALSDGNKKITHVEVNRPYQDNKQRFEHKRQVLCVESLRGRYYWEAEWTQEAVIAVTYKGICRRGSRNDCLFGHSKKSWSLSLSKDRCEVWHNNKCTILPADVPFSSRVGVFLDHLAGTLSFFSVSTDINKLTCLYTFHTKFTETLFAGFGLEKPGSSVTLCNM